MQDLLRFSFGLSLSSGLESSLQCFYCSSFTLESLSSGLESSLQCFYYSSFTLESRKIKTYPTVQIVHRINKEKFAANV